MRQTRRGRHSLLGRRVFGFIVRNHKTAHPGKDRKKKFPAHSRTFLQGTRRSARTTAFGMCCLPLSIPPPFKLAQGTGLAPLGQNTHQTRAELVLDLLSLRVKCHLYFEFSLVKPTSKWSRITCESLQVTDQLRTLSSLSYPVWLLL